MKRLIPALFLLLLLPACARTLDAQVTRFHTLDGAGGAPGAGQTVSIEPAGEAIMGPEFVTYADMLGARLSMQGFRPAGEAEAGIVARMAYRSELRQGLRTDGPQTSVGVGVGGGSRRGVGIGISGIFDVSGPGEDVYEYTLDLTLTDVSSGQRIFEGRSVIEAGAGDISAVMPFLMDALFTDFPGRSGQTVRVNLDLSN